MSDAREIPFSGVRVRFGSAKTFDELSDSLFSDIGAEPAQITDLPALADRDWDAFAADVQRQAGPNGCRAAVPSWGGVAALR